MKRRIVFVAIIAMLLLGGVLLVQYLQGSRENGSALLLSGTVEVTEVYVGFKMPGKISALLVDEGQRVTKGERIAVLENAEYRNTVDEGRAAVAKAEAEFAKARKDFERYGALSREGVITSQQMDSATRAYDVARSQLERARAALRVAEARLADTVAVSPLSGVVLVRYSEPGETVAAGVAVYSIGDMDDPWVKVYVNETKLGLVKLGQKAQVFVDTFPGVSYPGRVTYIASEAEFTPKNVQTREERVKLVFGTKVSVTNRDDELKPGMPADVKILLR